MNAFDLVLSMPWMIRREDLEAILAIADRCGEGPEAVAARLGRPLDNARSVTIRDGVAVVPVLGPIFRRANLFTEVSGATSTEVLATDIRAALDDPAVRGILLEIDSPGGQGTGIAELAAMIRSASEAKPTVAYVGGDAASAAYYLAAPAGEVVVDSMAGLGSIGVVMGRRDPSKGPKTIIEFVSSQSPGKRPDPTTERGRAQIQQYVDDLAAVFVADVARYRGVPVEAVLSDFGRGGMKVGRHAVEAGMADRLGSFEGVLSDLADGKVRPRGRTAPAAPSPPKRFIMAGWRENALRAIFGGDSEPAAADEPDKETRDAARMLGLAAPTRPAESAETRQLREQVAALEAANRTQAIDHARSEAESFAAGMVAAGKALPAEKARLAAIYAQALLDDRGIPASASVEASGTAQVMKIEAAAEGRATPPGRAASVKALFDARPTHGLFDERLAASYHVVPHPAGPSGHQSGESDEDFRNFGARMDELAARKHGVAANGKAS